MPSISRRRALRAGVLTLAGLAGCSAREDVPDKPIITRVSVHNLDDRPHPVAVYMELDETVEYWETHRLDAASAGENRASVTVEPPAFPREQGFWMFGFRRLDADRTHGFAPSVHDETCMEVSLLVNEDGSLSHGTTSHACSGSQ